ncbi:hypothetical protein BTO06_15835 [Tenacibaculum sp. SZ-18]|uniref:hypothetical protein n=1 Tax=Tenacibaculum sp. SZ-18 TaxID=754423 RepID=UPI000CA3E415|nr:hypothetical protein [Tenacibaculum sp. SZ-18]AUC17136.1 hypothetical protein BTO06_15835 [Tenacibaculum sp. SZ-18]
MKMTKEEYFEKAKFIWQNYVPKSGQAETVQGELLRAVEKLRDEAHRNGNINWDNGHEILGLYVKDTLINSNEFDQETVKQIKSDIQRLLIFEQPYLEDDIYDRLTDRIVDWFIKHPDPVSHELNPDLHR